MSCDKSQYCPYAHISAMLERTHLDWWMAMFQFECYFDDSGTDGGTPVAVAACYIASKTQWDEFVRNWDEVRVKEEFDVFHMAHFVAKPDAEHEPFCHWNEQKKHRVYSKLASIINTRVRKGFAIAVPKKPFDDHVFPEFKEHYAADHYTWAVKSVMGLVENWRKKFGITSPMQYVFDRGSLGEKQIKAVWDDCEKRDNSLEKYGMVPSGVMFQDKAIFKPLQAADILAWQVQNNMRRTVMLGRDANDPSLIHPGFKVLRQNGLLDMGFYSTAQTRRVFDTAKKMKELNGVWPWEPNAISASVLITEPGIVE
jgi:hypothetical protein